MRLIYQTIIEGTWLRSYPSFLGIIITSLSKIWHSKEEENGKKSKEPVYNEDKDQLEEEQEKKTGDRTETEQETTNKDFW